VKIKPEENELLQDLFGDDVEFRNALLHQTLTTIRRQKRMRPAIRSMGLIACLMAVGSFLFPGEDRQWTEPNRVISSPRQFQVVHSRAMPSPSLIRTSSGTTSIIQSTSNYVQVIETGVENRMVREINGEELLNLFAGRTAGIIQVSQREQLFMLGPVDPKRSSVE
jgi:hypothetical protein